MKMPGQNLTAGNRFATLLMQRPSANNGSVAGGIDEVARSFLAAMLMKQDQNQETEANQAFTKGMSAKPWTNPDTGGQTIPQDMGGQSGPPQMVPTARAGGLSGALSAMQGLGNNPYAGRFSQALMMQQAESEQATQQATQKAMLEDQLARARQKYEWDNKPTGYAPGTRVMQGGNVVADVPNRPEAPKTVTTAAGVFLQNADGTLGTRLGAPASQAGQPGPGMFQGNGLEAQMLNTLLTGDPASTIYQAAFNHMAQPKQTFDPATGQVVTINPNMSAFRPPAVQGAPQGAPQGTGMPNPPPQAQGGQPAPNAAGGVTVAPVPGAAMSPAVKKDMDAAMVGAATIVSALEGYRESAKKAGPWERTKSIAGANTPVNTAYNNAALMAKGQELYDLGVLNGPDLDVIRRTLPDPATLSGALSDDADVSGAVNQVVDLIQTRISAKMRQYGQPDVNIREYTKSVRPSSDPLADARDAIARGADRQAVMKRLQDNGIDPAGL